VPSASRVKNDEIVVVEATVYRPNAPAFAPKKLLAPRDKIDPSKIIVAAAGAVTASAIAEAKTVIFIGLSFEQSAFVFSQANYVPIVRFKRTH
jgi:hypothetical protein